MLFIKDGLWSQWMQFQEVAVFDHAFKTISLLYVMSINIYTGVCVIQCDIIVTIYVKNGWLLDSIYLAEL